MGRGIRHQPDPISGFDVPVRQLILREDPLSGMETKVVVVSKAEGNLVIPIFKKDDGVELASRIGEELEETVKKLGGREFKGDLEEVYPQERELIQYLHLFRVMKSDIPNN